MQPWTQTLIDAEDSLRKLEEAIHLVRTGWPAAGSETNGPATLAGPTPEALRQLTRDLSDIVRRCEDLPTAAVSTVESVWENLEADKLPDWDTVGHQVLELLNKQAEALDQAGKLVRRGERSGLLPQPQGKLSVERSRVLDRARDFLDSWPWSTGNKPGDEEDAAGARRAQEASPPFEVLWQLAKQYPPPPGWLNDE